MSLQLRGLAAWVRPYAEDALAWARYYGIRVTITSVYRAWAEQQRLRDRYLRGQSRFPANAPGDSAHQYHLSWDSVVAPADQDDWDAIRRYIGWHVPPNDRIHAEVPGWRDLV